MGQPTHAPLGSADTASKPRRSMSLFRYSPGLVLICIAIADQIRMPDPDMWGNVRFGQEFLAQHTLVLHDTYTYTELGHPWMGHEWLSEVMLAAAFNHGGVFGLILLKLALSATVIVALAAAVAETEASTLMQFAALIGAAVVLKPQLQFRPQSFEFAVWAVLIYLLTRDAYRRASPLWLAVPMLALWSNVHGGFFVGIAALGAYTAVSGWQDVTAGRGYQRATGLAVITVLSTLATLATPYGLDTWTTVAHALRNPYTRIVIVEWQPLMTAALEHWQKHQLIVSNYDIGIVMMAATTIAWALSVEAIDLPLCAIAGLMVVGAFISNRNLPIAMIALAAPMTRHLPRGWRRIFPAKAQAAAAPQQRSGMLNQAVLVILSLLIFIQGGFFSRKLPAADPYPVSAVDFMRQHQLKGKILSTFQWGMWMIWHMPSGSQLFIDGRYDTLFPLDIIYKFAVFNFDLPDGAAVLTEYPPDFVLIKPDALSRKIMDARPDWKLIYQDGSTMLYAKQDSDAAKIPGVPITGVAQPGVFP